MNVFNNPVPKYINDWKSFWFIWSSSAAIHFAYIYYVSSIRRRKWKVMVWKERKSTDTKSTSKQSVIDEGTAEEKELVKELALRAKIYIYAGLVLKTLRLVYSQ